MHDTALHRLVAGSIDYAGLFPPAGLDMDAAVRQYAEYRDGPDRWALGRLVVPVPRFQELERAAEAVAPRGPAEPWQLSALLGADVGEEVRALGDFNCRHAASGATALIADVIEAKAASVRAVDTLMDVLPPSPQIYIEVPLDPDPAPLLAALVRRGARAKVRTGGITPEAFPPTANLLRFLRACIDTDLPFKATAGLHHPLRAEYRLTYAPDSVSGPMFGFLNVFLTAAFLRQGMADADAARLLEEGTWDAFRLTDDAIEWRGHRLTRAEIDAARAEGIVSFGSCSFEEPVGELRAAGRL